MQRPANGQPKSLKGRYFLLFLVVLSLFSCANDNRNSESPIVLTIFVGFGTGTDYHQIELHQQLQREFNLSHQDINIQFVTVNYAEHDEKFMALLANGSVPDVVMPIGVQGIANYHEIWADLAPFMGKTAQLESDIYPKLLASVTEGKHVYGLPIGYYPAVLYYNADMFDRAKITYPPHKFGESGWNYDQVLKIAQKLTRDRNGKHPNDKGFDPENIAQYGYDGGDWAPLRALSSKFHQVDNGFSPDLKSAHINNAGWKSGLRFLRESIFEKYVRPKTTSGNTMGIFGDNDPLGSNRTAMWESFSWVQYAYSAWNNNFNWDVAAVPADGTHAPIVPCNIEAMAIPKAAKYPHLSWEVIKWLAQPEIMQRLCPSYGCIPARVSLGSTWMDNQKKINGQVDWQVFIDAADYIGIPNHEAWVPNYRKVQEALDALMNGITSGAIEDTDQAAEATNQQIQELLNQYWKNLARETEASPN